MRNALADANGANRAASSPVRLNAAAPRSSARRVADSIFMPPVVARVCDSPASKRITQPSGRRVMREQLVAIEIAVHRHLYYAIGVELVGHLDREARAYIGNRTHGIGRVSQSTSIGALVQ